MRGALRDLTPPVLALVIAIVILALARTRHSGVSPRPARARPERGRPHGSALGVARLAFSLLAAFVVFALADEFSAARTAVTAEAVAAESFAYEAARLPASVGQPLIERSSAYVETVVADEWPLMSEPGENALETLRSLRATGS